MNGMDFKARSPSLNRAILGVDSVSICPILKRKIPFSNLRFSTDREPAG